MRHTTPRRVLQVGRKATVLMDGSVVDVLEIEAIMSNDDTDHVGNAVKVRLPDGMVARFMASELKPV